MASLEELREVRIAKLNKLRTMGLDPYPSRVTRTHGIGEVVRNFEEIKNSETTVGIAGRIRGMRLHGGSAFLDIEDGGGAIQVFCEEKKLGGDTYAIVRELTDIGDFIETSGTVFLTKQDQQTIQATTFRVISKALRPIPEEHFGLKDTEVLFRRRYLDLLVNAETRELFARKARFWKSVRSFLDAHGFIEVDTPALLDVPGGADARPFITNHNALDRDFYLRISLELPLKKTIG